MVSIHLSHCLPLFLSLPLHLSVSKFPVQITVKQKVPSYKELNKKCSISFDQGAVKFFELPYISNTDFSSDFIMLLQSTRWMRQFGELFLGSLVEEMGLWVLPFYARKLRTNESTIIFSRVHLFSVWWAMTVPDFSPSIHPSNSLSLLWLSSVGSQWQQKKQYMPDVPLLSKVLLLPMEDPEMFPGQMRYEIPQVSTTSGSPLSAQKNSKGRCPIKGNQIRCLNHFSWPYSRQWSNGS